MTCFLSVYKFFVSVAPSPSFKLLLSNTPANRKTNHDGSLSYVFFARFILAIDQHASVARCAKHFNLNISNTFKVKQIANLYTLRKLVIC